MTNVVFLLIYSCVFSAALSFNFDQLTPKTSSETQRDEALNLIKRLIPTDAHKFTVVINSSIGPPNKDTFHVEKIAKNDVQIIGTSGVAAASGFHHYLKYYCNCHISWEGANLNVPIVLPEANYTITSNDRFRYYQNVCTTSYSFVWWNWPQWEKHIDWMALNSFNLVLAFNGQEAIWRRTYRKLNLTEEEISEHFSGPAFLSWSRMGNIRNWGGPLSEAWHEKSIKLQHQILERMRNLGITPVLSAFAGHVPRGLKRLYPNAKLSPTGSWNNFNASYCCPYILDPTDSLFRVIGNLYITELLAEFGTNHAYSCDTFNENLPTNSSLTYIRDIGHFVYSTIASVDPKAVWIMQNWLFVHDYFYWTNDRAKALLTSVPIGKMIVLDLQSEQNAQYKRLDSYYGQPYIWCMLHNFGGTLGMFGSVEIINKDIFEARGIENSTLMGTGITPEGINQNYVVYELMSEMAWRKKPTNLTEWFTLYVSRRYGHSEASAVEAWQILKSTVYNYTSFMKMRGKYAINRRPSLRIRTWSWYNTCDLMLAWDLFLKSEKVLNQSNLYLHDLVDITRQVLQVLGDQYYRELIEAVKQKQLNLVRSISQLFLELIADMESILKTSDAFLLGKWLESAKAAAYNKEEEKLFEYNARNQITLWGPSGEIVDYANKQWSGIASHFFLPRWTVFLGQLNESLTNGVKFDESTVLKKIFEEVESPFTFSRELFPIESSGDAVEIAKIIHEKWWTRAHCRFLRSKESPVSVEMIRK